MAAVDADMSDADAAILVAKERIESWRRAQQLRKNIRRAADAFAIDVMRKLGRSPKPLGDLLVRVTGTGSGKSVTLLSSHPMSEERLAMMSKETQTNSGPEILSAAEWKALKGICATR